MTADQDLRERFLWVVRTMVIAAGVALALGLLFYIRGTNATVADRSLHAGLIILMATPVVRTLIAVIERLRTRDVFYLVVSAMVLFELALTLWYATTRV